MTTRLQAWLTAALCLTLFSIGLIAQATHLQVSGTLPTHCTVGDVYVKTGTSAGFYRCSATDTWTALWDATNFEALLSFTDVTTGNASSSHHGLLLKLDANSAHFLDGTGAWSTPAGGGSTSKVCSKTVSDSPITISSSCNVYMVDASGGNVTMTLPTSASSVTGGVYTFYEVIKTDSSANTIAVGRSSSDTLDGATSFTLGTQYEPRNFLPDGSALWVIR